MSWIITGTQKNIWTPALISTTVWLDASDASTITLVGSKVSQWSDKSGNNNHWLQADDSLRPTYTQSLINGLPGVDVPQDTFMATANAVLQPDTHTMMAVVRRNSSGNFIDTLGSSTTGPNTVLAQIQSGFNAARFNNSSNVAVTFFSDATIAVGSVAILGQSHSPTGNFTSNSVFQMGRETGAAAAPKQYGEVILTTSQLSGYDRERLEGYLAHKWGLTANLPADHPYKTVIPVP
jgi:hypothetical protein